MVSGPKSHIICGFWAILSLGERVVSPSYAAEYLSGPDAWLDPKKQKNSFWATPGCSGLLFGLWAPIPSDPGA